MICALHPHLCQFDNGGNALAHALALLRAFLAWHPVLFAGMAIVLPRQLRLVFDVESDTPALLGTYEGEREDVVYYVDSRGDSCGAPADCVSIVTYNAQASLGPRTVEFDGASPLRPALGRDRGQIVRDEDTIARLYGETVPKPGCPGVRVDRVGREWYSARWIEVRS